MSGHNEYSAFFVGCIAGGILGAIAGLLLAPRTGSEYREMIKDRSMELRDRAENLAREIRARAEESAQFSGRDSPLDEAPAAEPSGSGGGRPMDEYQA